MRQLILLRHAKSDWDAPAGSDHARKLNARGRAAAAGLRQTLRAAGLVPDVVLVSSARRTLQTLDALAPWDETPIIEPMDGLYLAEPKQILAVLAGIAETVRSLMVIGHNPGLHDLAMILAGPPAMVGGTDMMRDLEQGFPTAGLAEFTVPQTWRELGEGAGDAASRLVRFVRPAPHPGGGASE